MTRGRVSEKVHNLMKSLHDPSLVEAIHEVLDCGSSSGMDFMVGVAFGLNLIENNKIVTI
jgi:hypothetical protein